MMCSDFGMGTVPLVLVLNSLLKMIVDCGEWVNELQKIDQKVKQLRGRS